MNSPASSLTEPQRAAVHDNSPQIACIAGPGSGKSTVTALRIQRLIDEGVKPSELVAITYTNAAARNLEERVQKHNHLTQSEEAYPEVFRVPLGFAGTLHGFCFRMLKDHGEPFGYGPRTAILAEEAALDLLASAAKTLKCKTPLKEIAAINALGRPKHAGDVAEYTREQLVVLNYREQLAEAGLLDFDMILTEFFSILTETGGFHSAIVDQFKHLFVDEVQDCALIDWKIFHALPIANKFLVGDPDQGIFGFRGGDSSLLVAFAQMHETTRITLEENFRCDGAICIAANRLIAHNTDRIEKFTLPALRDPVTMQTQRDGWVRADPAAISGDDEIANVLGKIKAVILTGTEPHEIAVLARTNAIATAFRDALKAMGVAVEAPAELRLPNDWPRARALIAAMAQPHNDTLMHAYVIEREQANGLTPTEARAKAHTLKIEAAAKGHSIFKLWFSHLSSARDEVGGILAYEQLCAETRAIIGETLRALPPGATLADLAIEVQRYERPPLVPRSEGVACTTIHDFKGREADVVFLVGWEEEVIPGKRKDTDVDEERRLAFVGITRARHELYISHAAARRQPWGDKRLEAHTPSRFIAEACGHEAAGGAS